MNYVNKNRINNYICMYSIENTEENFKKSEQVIEKKEYIISLYINRFYT